MISSGRLPDFLVIGAYKAGTTSLDFYLSLHPEIHMAHPKEPRYFMDDPEQFGRWHRGEEWYRSLFNTKRTLAGETSPGYSAEAIPSCAARRAADLVPEARLIYLVREPMARLFSHYLMLLRQGKESAPLADCLSAGSESLMLRASQYATQFEEWSRYYPADRILVVESKELEEDRSGTLRRVFAFLGVAENFFSPLFWYKRNLTKHTVVPNATGQRLLASPPVLWAQRHLSIPVFAFLCNWMMKPFREKSPDMRLPETMERNLRELFRDEVSRLRVLTGQALPGLD